MRAASVGAALLLLSLAGGCAEPDRDPPAQPEGASASPSATPEPEQESGVRRREEVQAEVIATMSGARELEWRGDATLRIMRVGSAGATVDLLSVGMPVPRKSAATEYMRWAFDLIGGFRDRPGTYLLEDAPGDELSSNALVVYVRAKLGAPNPPTADDQVEELLEFRTTDGTSCTIKIQDAQGDAGEIDCPQLRTASGEAIALHATWSVTGEN